MDITRLLDVTRSYVWHDSFIWRHELCYTHELHQLGVAQWGILTQIHKSIPWIIWRSKVWHMNTSGNIQMSKVWHMNTSWKIQISKVWHGPYVLQPVPKEKKRKCIFSGNCHTDAHSIMPAPSRFLIISRWKFKLKLWLIWNLYRDIWVSLFGGFWGVVLSVGSGILIHRLIDMWDMTRSHVWHDSFICVTWLIHSWFTDSSISVTKSQSQILHTHSIRYYIRIPSVWLAFYGWKYGRVTCESNSYECVSMTHGIRMHTGIALRVMRMAFHQCDLHFWHAYACVCHVSYSHTHTDLTHMSHVHIFSGNCDADSLFIQVYIPRTIASLERDMTECTGRDWGMGSSTI